MPRLINKKKICIEINPQCSSWLIPLSCFYLLSLSGIFAYSAPNEHPSNIQISIGATLMTALQTFEENTGKSVYASPSNAADLQNSFPAGTYDSVRFLAEAQRKLGTSSVDISDKSVDFTFAPPAIPSLSVLNPDAARRIGELHEFNSILESILAIDLKKWIDGDYDIPVDHFSTDKQTYLMNIVRKLGSNSSVNGVHASDFTNNASLWNVEIGFVIELDLSSPDGSNHPVTLSYSPTSMHNARTYRLTSLGTGFEDNAVKSSIPAPAARSVPLADILHGKQIQLPSTKKGLYSLDELAAAVEKQTTHEIIVDKNLRNRQMLILCPSSTIDVGAFLAEQSDNIDTITKHEVMNEADKENNVLTSFVFQNFPRYVDGLNQQEFLRVKRHWRTLSEHEKKIIMQIVPQSSQYLTDVSLVKLLKDPQNLPDTIVSYNIISTFEIKCKKGFAVIPTYNLLTSNDTVD